MSGYDYASEVLAPRSPPSRTTVAPQAPAERPAQADYASELLNPNGDRFATNVQKRIEEEKAGGTASFGGMVKSGMVDDQQTKIRILANDLFPGEKDAQERFGVMNGDIVYVG